MSLPPTPPPPPPPPPISKTQVSQGAAAEARAKHLFRRTPLIRSDPLSRLTGMDVYLKLDALQASGSFKDRGMAHMCLELVNTKGVTNIISSSGGNAGLAAATVAQQLNLSCTVVVPTTTKPLVIEKLKSLGATVIVSGDNWNAADAVVQQMVSDDTTGKTAYIPPYEHPLLWTGHSSVVDEIYDDDIYEYESSIESLLPPPAATIIASVGGGGLLCGVLEGLERHGRPCNVVAAETSGASCFGQSWATNTNDGGAAAELVTLDAITSVATSLGALRVSATAVERSVRHQDTLALGTVTSAICTDAEAVDACLKLARDHRILVEPACGAALAVLYSERLRKEVFAAGSSVGGVGPIVVQVCGGSGVSLDLLQQWKTDFSL